MAADNRYVKNLNIQKRKPVKNPNPMSNTKTMGREGMRLIRNMAHGKFSMYNEGHVFRNVEFVKATLNEIDKRLVEASIHITAIEYAYPGSREPSVIAVLERDKKTFDAYTIAKDSLASILKTGDVGFLYVMINKLPAYKYNI